MLPGCPKGHRCADRGDGGGGHPDPVYAAGLTRRWVVERTNSWHNNFRALKIRWERKALHYGALIHLASALVAFRAARRRNGHRF